MGFVKTINTILKELISHSKSGAGDSTAELINMARGVGRIPMKEFGRIKNLEFNPSWETRGSYVPGDKNIIMNPNRDDLLNTYLHEFIHGKEMTPNMNEFNQMSSWARASEYLPYIERPTERAAFKGSSIARYDPSKLNEAFGETKRDFGFVGEHVQKGLDKATAMNALESVSPELYAKHRKMEMDAGKIDTMNLEKFVKPYLGKGWLFSATPLFAPAAIQSGSED